MDIVRCQSFQLNRIKFACVNLSRHRVLAYLKPAELKKNKLQFGYVCAEGPGATLVYAKLTHSFILSQDVTLTRRD